jgi:hypothetical protein
MGKEAAWREVDLERRLTWRRIFNADWQNDAPTVACPVCSQPTLHRWYIAESDRAVNLRGQSFVGHGRLWEWCSTCRTYEYYPDGYVPDWWEAPYAVDAALLCSDPSPIEAARAVADERSGRSQ